MKIIHVTSVHSKDDVRIFHKQCCGLSKLGHNVTLIVPGAKTEKISGVNIVGLPMPNGRLSRLILTSGLGFYKALRQKGEIYHFHDPELIPYALVLRCLGYCVVYDMHENLPLQIMDKTWLPKNIRPILSKAVKTLEFISLRFFGVVFAEHSYLKSYTWINKKVTVLNLPIIEDLIDVDEKKLTVFTVGYIGGVTKDRGAIKTIDAIKKLRKYGYNIEYECIGPVSDDVFSSEVYQNALAQGWLRSPGRVSPHAGWLRMGSCNVGFALLRPIGNYIESYPTKIFEYMALGLPVITSNFPLYKEIVEKNECGLCVDPDDLDSICDAIKKIIENQSLAIEMGVRGREAVFKYYNWQNELEKLTSFYGSLYRKT